MPGESLSSSWLGLKNSLSQNFMGDHHVLVGGIPTPLKNMKVSWDDDIPNRWKDKKSHVPNHQPVFVLFFLDIIKGLFDRSPHRHVTMFLQRVDEKQ